MTLWDRQQVRGSCEDWGAGATHQIELDEPLAGRTLLDGYCLAARPGEDESSCPSGEMAMTRPVSTP